MGAPCWAGPMFRHSHHRKCSMLVVPGPGPGPVLAIARACVSKALGAEGGSRTCTSNLVMYAHELNSLYKNPNRVKYWLIL